MKYKISGNNLQIVTIEISPGEKIFAESGAMVYMSANVKMEAKARGGIMQGLKRMLTKESFFLTEFTTQGGVGLVAFAGRVPGTIKPIEITPGKKFLAEKDAFLCAQDSVNLNIAFQQKLGAGLLGGEGFILQEYSGNGTVFIHGCGDFVEFDLQPGQLLKVDTGCVVGWDGSVGYDIQRVGNIKTSLFGGEGLFLVSLTGPGHIILQSMTLQNLARALIPFIGQSSGGGGRLISIGQR